MLKDKGHEEGLGDTMTFGRRLKAADVLSCLLSLQ